METRKVFVNQSLKNDLTLLSKQPSVPGEQAKPGRGTKSSCGMTLHHMVQLQPDGCTSFLHHSDKGAVITGYQH